MFRDAIRERALDGMPLAHERTRWVWPLLPNRSHLRRSTGPETFEPALYQLLEGHYEDVKALWEEQFEKKYGFWRGFVDSVVARSLDCGTVEAGFARLNATPVVRKNC